MSKRMRLKVLSRTGGQDKNPEGEEKNMYRELEYIIKIVHKGFTISVNRNLSKRTIHVLGFKNL